MKLDIKELIKKRLNYEMHGGPEAFDDLLKKHLEESKDEFAIIQPNGLMERLQNSGKYPDLKKYYVTGIYELGNINCSKYHHSILFTLFTFSTKKPQKFRICFIPKFILDSKKTNLPINKEEDVSSYYADLETYINMSKVGDNLKPLANTVPYSEFRKNNFNICYYSREYLSVKKSLKKQKIVELKDLVEIFSFKQDAQFCLKKNDIVLSNWHGTVKFQFVDESTIKKIKLTSLSTILRVESNRITAEYLYLYMQSRLFKILSLPVVYNRPFVQKNILNEVPVLLPNTKTPMAKNKELSQKYQDFYKWIGDEISSKIKTDDLANYKEILKKNCNCDSIMKDNLKYYASLEDQYVQYIENACSDIKFDSYKFNEDYYAFYKKLSQPIVDEDALSVELQKTYVEEPHKQKITNYIKAMMAELKTSIPNGAYQSAIVLMGAALEAFLIDWAGEKDGKNYFEVPYRTVNIDGRIQSHDMSLNDAIGRIGKVVKKWSARDNAEAIRKMRNSIVHPKVYLEQNEMLTKEKCDAALQDLDAVIKSRYDDFFANFFEKYSLM